MIVNQCYLSGKVWGAINKILNSLPKITKEELVRTGFPPDAYQKEWESWIIDISGKVLVVTPSICWSPGITPEQIRINEKCAPRLAKSFDLLQPVIFLPIPEWCTTMYSDGDDIPSYMQPKINVFGYFLSEAEEIWKKFIDQDPFHLKEEVKTATSQYNLQG